MYKKRVSVSTLTPTFLTFISNFFQNHQEMKSSIKHISKEMEESGGDVGIDKAKVYISEFQNWLMQYKGKSAKKSFFSQKSFVMKFLQFIANYVNKNYDPFKQCFGVLPLVIEILIEPGNDFEIRKETLSIAIILVDYARDELHTPYNFWIANLMKPLFSFNTELDNERVLHIGEPRNVTVNDIITFNEILLNHLDVLQGQPFIFWIKLLFANSITAVLSEQSMIPPDIKLKFAQKYAYNIAEKVNKAEYLQFLVAASKMNKQEPRAFMCSYLEILEQIIDNRNARNILNEQQLMLLFENPYDIYTTLPGSSVPISEDEFFDEFMKHNGIFSHFGHSSEAHLSNFCSNIIEIDPEKSCKLFLRLFNVIFMHLSTLTISYVNMWSYNPSKFKTQIFRMSHHIQLTNVMYNEMTKFLKPENFIQLLSNTFKYHNGFNIALSFFLRLLFEKKISLKNAASITKTTAKSPVDINFFRAFITILTILSYGIHNNIDSMNTVRKAVDYAFTIIGVSFLDTIRDYINFSFITFLDEETLIDKTELDQFLSSFIQMVDSILPGIAQNSFLLVWYNCYLNDKNKTISEYNDSYFYKWVTFLKNRLNHEPDKILNREYILSSLSLIYSGTIYSFDLFPETIAAIRNLDRPIDPDLLIPLSLTALDIFCISATNLKLGQPATSSATVDARAYLEPLFVLLNDLLNFAPDREQAILVAFSAIILVFTRDIIGYSSITKLPTIKDLFDLNISTISAVLAMIVDSFDKLHPSCHSYILLICQHACDQFLKMLSQTNPDITLLKTLVRFAASMAIVAKDIKAFLKYCEEILLTKISNQKIDKHRRDVLKEMGFQLGELLNQKGNNEKYVLTVRTLSTQNNFELEFEEDIPSSKFMKRLFYSNIPQIQKRGMILYASKQQKEISEIAENDITETSKTFVTFVKSIGIFNKKDSSVSWRTMMESGSVSLLPAANEDERISIAENEELAIIWDMSGDEHDFICDFNNLKVAIILRPVLMNYILVKIKKFNGFDQVIGPLSDQTLLSRDYLPRFVRWTVCQYYCSK